MRELRECESSQLYTGVSKCPPEFDNMKGAILVKPGTKLPAKLTASKLEELVHADRPDRVYGIVRFVEYAENGGDVQSSANGYDGESPSGVNARRDTFTLNRFYPELDASLTKSYNEPWDVYFFDGNNFLYGLNDGSDVLAGYPMTSVYSDSTPFNTSGAKATMSVNFSHEDAKRAKTDFDYVKLSFNPLKCILGLTPVRMEAIEINKNGMSGTGSDYKIYEKIGGNDVTAIYGPLIATSHEDVLTGTNTSVSYDSVYNTLMVTSTAGTVRLKEPSVLFENGIKGIEQVG